MDGALRDPEIPDGETTAYRGVVNGRELGIGRITVERADDAYVQRLEATVAGEAQYAMDLRFRRRRGAILAEHYRLETRHRERPVATEEGWFRDVRTLQFGGEVEPYPRGVVPLLGAALALRGLEFEPRAERSVSVWLANTLHWEVALRVDGSETVASPAGEAPAWRVLARPSMEEIGAQVDRMLAPLIPPIVLHFEREGPHRLLRFEFPTGPFPWNPRGLIEATSLD